MSSPETPTPPTDPKPPGRFKQSRLDNNQDVENWLGGNGRLVFGVMAIILVLGFFYFALFL